MNLKLKMRVAAVALAVTPCAFAVETETMREVEVRAEKLLPLPAPSDTALDQNSLDRKRTNTSDTAKLLDGQPGVSFHGAGGVSSLPVIHGMADDRVRVKVDGMDLISACANHMNPPLSHIDPSSVGSISVYAGITPVSVGGDSIGGTIQVNSQAPEFAREGQGTLLKRQAGVLYRSNGNAQGANLAATIASENLSVMYGGSTVKSGNYRAAQDFKAAGPAATGRGWLDGNEVGSSLYQANNQSVGFALRHENDLVELKLGLQEIPYQGFPNQRMDMTGNNSKQANLRYAGQYQWGVLETRVYNENTHHRMNFLEDKQFVYGTAPGMPMETRGRNTGALVKADIALSEQESRRGANTSVIV